MDKEALIHFIGGAAGGTAGTALTCPLEVVKTRMQSSRGFDHVPGNGPSTSSGGSRGAGGSQASKSSAPRPSPYKHILANNFIQQLSSNNRFSHGSPMAGLSFRSVSHASHAPSSGLSRFTIIKHLVQIVKTEGLPGLYKGLGPNLIGVAPSKAVYFYTYSSCKRFWNDADWFLPNSAIIHMASAGAAGFVAATAVNPIWLVKTRLQLYEGRMSIWQMVRRVHQKEGIKGFYKGVTASYAGISETVIQFVLYEHLRQLLVTSPQMDDGSRNNVDFLHFMLAGGTAKFFACVMAYPHEVVRTRLREEGSQARGFFSTLYQLYRQGVPAMYRGLSVQLLRTVPNTAITMGTYELVVYGLHAF